MSQQTDSVSCGVFTYGYATLCAQGISVQHFSMFHVTRMRIHMANCILFHICPPLRLMGQQSTVDDTQLICTRQGSPEDHLVQSDDVTGFTMDATHDGVVGRDDQHGVSSTVDSHDDSPGSDGKH